MRRIGGKGRALIAFGLGLLALAGCSKAPRVDSYLVRIEGTGAYGFQPKGFVRAREDEAEGGLPGDNVKLQRDLETEGAFGWGARADVRPFHNDELSLEYRDAGSFEGDAVLHRSRRFDGRTYASGEHVRSTFEWESWRASVAHRVLALGNPTGPSGPLADILVRLGAEQSTFDTELEGSPAPKESRELRSGAPFIGLEGRAAVMPRTTFEHALHVGYWNHSGSRLNLLDASAGFRVQVAGPLHALLRYEFLLRDAQARLDDGELSRVSAQIHLVSVGLAVEF